MIVARVVASVLVVVAPVSFEVLALVTEASVLVVALLVVVLDVVLVEVVISEQ